MTDQLVVINPGSYRRLVNGVGCGSTAAAATVLLDPGNVFSPKGTALQAFFFLPMTDWLWQEFSGAQRHILACHGAVQASNVVPHTNRKPRGVTIWLHWL